MPDMTEELRVLFSSKLLNEVLLISLNPALFCRFTGAFILVEFAKSTLDQQEL